MFLMDPFQPGMFCVILSFSFHLYTENFYKPAIFSLLQGLQHRSKVPQCVQILLSLVSCYPKKCHPAVKQSLDIHKDSCNSAAVVHGDLSSSLQTALRNLHQIDICWVFCRVLLFSQNCSFVEKALF